MKPIEGTIILSGGGDEQQSLTLDNFFLERIPTNGTILYIPLALLGHRLYDGAPDWFKSVLELHSRPDISILVGSNLDTIKEIDSFDAIYIGGGNTWKLRKLIYENDFNKQIINFISSEKVVYGGSAGAILLGKNISCQDDEKNDNTDNFGINLVNGYSVACHYTPKRDLEIFEWCKKNNEKIIAIPEESGVIVFQEEMFSVGSASCFIFTPSEEKLELKQNSN